MLHLVEYLQVHPGIAVIIAMSAVLFGFLIYAVWSTAHDEHERIRNLERELGPKLAKYDRIGRKPKRRFQLPWFHRRNQPQGSS